MFIDCHVHAYRTECPKADGQTQFASPAEVIRRYDEMGIERGALMPLIGPEHYLPQSNEDILDMCEDSGGRLFPMCNIDPRGLGNSPAAPLDYWMQHYKARGCRGLGEIMPNLPFSDPRCQNLFRCAEKVGLPLTFDICASIPGHYGFYDDPGLPQLERTLKSFPALIILGHGPAFWSEMGTLDMVGDRGGYPKYPVRAEGAVPTLFRKCPNLYGDLSAGSGYNALARDRSNAVRFLNEFQDRLLYGTDLCSVSQNIPLIPFLTELRDEGRLDDAAFRKISRENAIRVFGL